MKTRRRRDNLYEVTLRDMTNSDRFAGEDGFGMNTPLTVYAKNKDEARRKFPLGKMRKDKVEFMEIKRVYGVQNPFKLKRR